MEGSSTLEDALAGEPTLASEGVFDLDLPSVGGPALGICHVRVYRPAGRPAVVVVGQLHSTQAAPVLATATLLRSRIQQRLPGAGDDEAAWLAYYPQGSLSEGSSGFFYFDRLDAHGTHLAASYEEVTELAGGPVRRYTVAEATVNRLP